MFHDSVASAWVQVAFWFGVWTVCSFGLGAVIGSWIARNSNADEADAFEEEIRSIASANVTHVHERRAA